MVRALVRALMDRNFQRAPRLRRVMGRRLQRRVQRRVAQQMVLSVHPPLVRPLVRQAAARPPRVPNLDNLSPVEPARRRTTPVQCRRVTNPVAISQADLDLARNCLRPRWRPNRFHLPMSLAMRVGPKSLNMSIGRRFQRRFRRNVPVR